MSPSDKIVAPRLIKKLMLVFLLLIILMGASYIFITAYFANGFIMETSQKVNADVAKHLIEEKFQDDSPFLADGTVNKALFGDLMHDMMAVNRSIEVYLLDNSGTVLYSVVLDPDSKNKMPRVDLEPVRAFIASNGQEYLLGDDPREPGEQKIFSAAYFESGGHTGYIYIILAGQEYQMASNSLLGTYFLRLGVGASLLAMLFAMGIALVSLWFLTRNLRQAIRAIRKFQAGDLEARIGTQEGADLDVFADSFNQMADTIVQSMDNLKSVDMLRRELIANISHDLRTPLAILKGYVETLQMKDSQLSARERSDYLKTIHDNVDRLSKLINQLFEYSKLEAEQVHPEMEVFSITELSHDLIAKFRVLADQKQIRLLLRNPEGNLLVHADVGLVERALQNLLENSIKFTEPGGEVELILGPRGDHVEISISDTGRGIPESEQPYIFERYKQVHRSRKSQGHGLGLAIVKKIMDLHNTTIRVLSSPQGSTFSFELPAIS